MKFLSQLAKILQHFPETINRWGRAAIYCSRWIQPEILQLCSVGDESSTAYQSENHTISQMFLLSFERGAFSRTGVDDNLTICEISVWSHARKRMLVHKVPLIQKNDRRMRIVFNGNYSGLSETGFVQIWTVNICAPMLDQGTKCQRATMRTSSFASSLSSVSESDNANSNSRSFPGGNCVQSLCSIWTKQP